jgi:hypothetical protein
MSGTRTSKDNSVFHQAKFASSPDFERGLIANLVAKRAALLEDKADRELIWFIQYMSHQEGGIAALAKDIMAKYPDRIQTIHMAELKLKPGKTCTGNEVKSIRDDFPDDYNYLLKGDEAYHAHCILFSGPGGETRPDPYPNSYPASVFFSRCETEAAKNLHNELSEICLNPERDLNAGKPWYFPTLIQTLREHQANFIQQKSEGVAITSLGAKVFEVLDYTFYSRGLTLMEGNARTGKSFSAKAWCARNPGRARFVEVPPYNDDAGFFRALARGLGLGNFLNYKPSQIRERVESVLLTGDLILVLDEAQRLWPLHDLKRGHPNRIVWVMTMANAGVPISCVSTPQFFNAQKAMEKSGWNSAQLTGRIAHYESLPVELSDDDLMAVARVVMPHATDTVLKALSAYARSSARYLAAVDTIATRASFIASRDGRPHCSTNDVREAMRQMVIPSDQRLQSTLRATAPARARRSAAMELGEQPQPGIDRASALQAPAAMDAGAPHKRGNLDAHEVAIPDDFTAPLIEA